MAPFLIFGGRRPALSYLQVCDYSKRQNRQRVGNFHSSILHSKWTAGKKIVRVLKGKRLGKLDCCVFPILGHWQNANARRKSRRDYNHPLVSQMSGEADATFRKRSTWCHRQISSPLKKVNMLASKLQDALC